MALNPLVYVGAAALAYFGAYKPAQDRKKRDYVKLPTPPPPVPTRPWIVFSADCGWNIPESWWSEVAQPKFHAIISEAKSGLSGEPALDAVRALNSHVVTHRILQGESPESCPMPAANVDLANPVPGATQAQQLMINLMAHVLAPVEGGLALYIQSQGTKIQLDLAPALPEPANPPNGGQWPPAAPTP